MNRYDSPNDVYKRSISPTGYDPSAFSTPSKFSYKLPIASIIHSEVVKFDVQEDKEGQRQLKPQFTFKAENSVSSIAKNPFFEEYLQSNNITENLGLNASVFTRDNFENTYDSSSLMEIPSERPKRSMVAPLVNLHKSSNPLEVINQNRLPTQESATTKTENSFTLPATYSSATRVKTLEESTTTPTKRRICSATRQSLNKSNAKKKHYENVLEELLQREKENKIAAHTPKKQNSRSPRTPRLGMSPCRNSATGLRSKSRGAVDRRKSREGKDASALIKEDPKEALARLNKTIEEANNEREYLKIYVQQLRVLMKKEDEEKIKLEKNIKSYEHEINRIAAKQKQAEKQSVDTKEQLQKNKEEVIKLLEEVDGIRKNLGPVLDKIKEEKDETEHARRKLNALKIFYNETMKHKDQQKALAVQSKKEIQRMTVTYQSLERTNLSFLHTFENHIPTEGDEN